jgi:hypothetical protein
MDKINRVAANLEVDEARAAAEAVGGQAASPDGARAAGEAAGARADGEA